MKNEPTLDRNEPMRVAPYFAIALALVFGFIAGPALGQYGGGAPAGNEQPAPYAGGASQARGGVGSGLFPAIDAANDPIMSPRDHEQFASRVDVSPLRKLAVFHGGRAKILDTLARESIQNMHGRSSYKRPRGDPRYIAQPDGSIDVQRSEEMGERSFDPVFTFLDLIFNPEHYVHRPLVHVPHVDVRRTLTLPLERASERERERAMRDGRVPATFFSHPDAQPGIEKMRQDHLEMQRLQPVSFALQTFMTAGETLNLVSPEPGDTNQRWPHIGELAGAGGDSHARRGDDGTIQLADYAAGGDPELRGEIIETVRSLRDAWRQTDPAAVNLHIRQLAELLPQVHPETYPAQWRRTLEYLYNVTNRFTYSYIAYFGAFVALLLAFATTWRKPLMIGGVLLGIGFVGHSMGLFTRIVLSDRPWTIHNQFESFFVLTWFAALAGLVLLVVKRQWIFGAAAAAVSAGMLLVANQRPIPSSEIAPVAAILGNSNILYVHVNIMIFAYALISLALILAIFYLWTYYSSSDSAVRLAAAGIEPTPITAGGGGATGGGPGAEESQPARAVRSRAALLNDLDQAQMVVIQLVFWLAAVGILLGAYWADHSWGRWWAWDPKETWALILWIVYLAAIHLRFAVKRRGLVTAWMAVLGFFTMLWTHWGVNLLLSGLHSYA